MLEAGTTVEGLQGSFLCEEKQGEGGFGIVWRGKRTDARGRGESITLDLKLDPAP